MTHFIKHPPTKHADKTEDNHPSHRRIAIVGAGFTGSTIAIRQADLYLDLLRDATQNGTEADLPALTIQLIEQSGRHGPGLPYSMEDDACKVNQDADEMSPFPDAPHHFTAWLNAHGPARPYTGGECVSRRLYGAYLADILEAKCAEIDARFPPGTAGPHVRIERIAASIDDLVVDAQAGTILLHASDGDVMAADSLVMATGHVRGDLLAGLEGHARYTPLVAQDADGHLQIAQTRDIAAQLRAAQNDPDTAPAVAILGNGQSMMDVLVALNEAGYGGRIFVISDNQVEPWLYRPEDYAAAKGRYALEHFDPQRIAGRPPDPEKTLNDVLNDEIAAGRAAGFAEGHVLGEIWHALFAGCAGDTPPLGDLETRMRNVFVKKYGNPTCQAHFDLYQSMRDAERLILVRGRVESADQITDDTHGLHISGLKSAQNLYVSHVYNAAMISRDSRRNPLVAAMFAANLLDVACDEIVVQPTYAGLIEPAGVPSSPFKYGVGTFRTGNAQAALTAFGQAMSARTP